MKKIILLFLLILGCQVTTPKTSEDDAEKAREQFLNTTYLRNESERLSAMPAPVVVVIKGPTVQGDPTKAYDIVVRAGNGKFYSFHEVGWASVNVGDVLK